MADMEEHVFRAARFSIGIDAEGGAFLSIPVSNRLVDYEERYRLTRAQYDAFLQDPEAGRRFAEACRAREKDDLLTRPPGSDRGVAR